MGSLYGHPHPAVDRIAQYGGLSLTIVLILAGLGQLGLAFTSQPLFALNAIITLLLIAPVMMLTSATPAVIIAPEGITLKPLVWRECFVPWADVREIKDYPLLPPKDAEVVRALLQGRRNYRPAEGKMLVIPALPLQYRFTGIFAGAGFTGVIGLTNRTHTDYDALIQQIEKYTRNED